MSLGRVLRARAEGETGLTLAEVMVAAMVMGIVAAVFLSVLVSVQKGVGRQQERSQDNDQARLAVEQLDREIRSGNVLYDPEKESPAFYSLRVYTQANAPTRNPAFQCVQWLIQDQQLLRRSWPPGRPEDVSGWRVVAEGIVNVEEGVPAFVLDPDPSKGGRTVDITILVNNRLAGQPGQTIRIQTAITGRNTSYGFPEGVCPAPAT